MTPRLWDADGLNPQAFNLLAQIARDQEDWTEGLRLSREAYGKSGKKTPNVRATYGEFLVRSTSASDKAEGEKVFAALVDEDKAGVLAAADAWQRLDQYGRAADVAKKGLERDPDDPELLFRLAASLERDKKLGESEAAFERLLKVRPDHAAGMNYLGYMWADRGENLPRALDLIRKAVDLEPSNGAYLDSLGWVYFRLDKLEKAEESLVVASSLNPDDATVEEHLGDLWAKKGDLKRARESWKRALTLKPEPENRTQARGEAPEDRDPRRRQVTAQGIVRPLRFAVGGRCAPLAPGRWLQQRSVHARAERRRRGSGSSSLRGGAARAWDSSRRFKALFRAEVSPRIGAIGRGYLSVWWDGASGSLSWRTSAPIAGAGNGGLLRKGSGAAGDEPGVSPLPGKLGRPADLIACILGTPDAPASPSDARRCDGDGSSRCAFRPARS